MSVNIEEQVRSSLKKLSNLCCWNVQNTHSSWLSLNFGHPRLEIRDPSTPEQLKSVKSEKLRAVKSLRRVTLVGEYWLWIDCCNWQITYEQRSIAHSESSPEIIREALKTLDGQILKRIEILAKPARTTFIFDLGCEVVIESYKDIEERGLWHFYDYTDSTCLSLLDNNCIQYGSADEKLPPTYSVASLTIEMS